MITDWDDAYDNRTHVAGSAEMIAGWHRRARSFREARQSLGRARLGVAYGAAPRQKLDLFLPDETPAGLALFIHGGYWRALDRDSASHFAAGVLGRGWACAIPGYTLCPEARISAITREIAAAIGCAAGLVGGPIAICGHSAGGHAAVRMACADAALDGAVRRRIGKIVTISGLHDLRPLLRTRLNDVLRLDPHEAAQESPVLAAPVEGTRLRAWCGGAELPEFIRQSELIANVWTGLGADCAVRIQPGRHHFDIVDALADPTSEMVGDLVAAPLQASDLPENFETATRVR